MSGSWPVHPSTESYTECSLDNGVQQHWRSVLFFRAGCHVEEDVSRQQDARRGPSRKPTKDPAHLLGMQNGGRAWHVKVI